MYILLIVTTLSRPTVHTQQSAVKHASKTHPAKPRNSNETKNNSNESKSNNNKCTRNCLVSFLITVNPLAFLGAAIAKLTKPLVICAQHMSNNTKPQQQQHPQKQQQQQQ